MSGIRLSFGDSRPVTEEPLRVLVVGGFATTAVPDRTAAHPVDPAEFGGLMQRLAPRLTLGDGEEVSLGSLRQLRPESLAASGGGDAMLKARAVLVDVAGRRLDAGAALARLAALPLPGDLAERLAARLKAGTAGPSPPARPTSGSGTPVDAIIQAIGASSAAPGSPALTDRAGHALAELDHALSQRVRAILDHPGFQRLERAWRGLRFLLSGVDPRGALRLFVQHCEPEDLALGLRESVAFTRAVAGPAPPEWGLVVLTDLLRGEPAEVLETARALARSAETLGAPVLAGVDFDAAEALVGSESPPDWRNWRGEAPARHLALALNGFLLREPSDPASASAGSFRFRDEAESVLRGSPALVLARIVADSMARSGWPTSLTGAGAEVEGLPLLPLPEGPSAGERSLTPEAAESWASAGFVPLVPVPGRDRLRVLRAPTPHPGWSLARSLASARLTCLLGRPLRESGGSADPVAFEGWVRRQLGEFGAAGDQTQVEVQPAPERGDGVFRLRVHGRPGAPILPTGEEIDIQLVFGG